MRYLVSVRFLVGIWSSLTVNIAHRIQLTVNRAFSYKERDTHTTPASQRASAHSQMRTQISSRSYDTETSSSSFQPLLHQQRDTRQPKAKTYFVLFLANIVCSHHTFLDSTIEFHCISIVFFWFFFFFFCLQTWFWACVWGLCSLSIEYCLMHTRGIPLDS